MATLTQSGRDCKNGHVNPLRYGNGNCRECLREKNAALQVDPEFAQRKRDRENARYRANPEKYNARSRAYHAANRERLNDMAAKRYALNRDARIEAMRVYRETFPERVKASNRRYHIKNAALRSVKARAWRLKNLEAIRERAKVYGREHYRKNKSYYLAKGALSKRRLRQATPPWADLTKIVEIYQSASMLSTPSEKFSVDHVIPLRGKNVCGLHVHNNLQIMTLRRNKSKGNRWNG